LNVLGGDIRRLSIALEMIALPDVLVVENPTASLDALEGCHVVSRLQIIADKGHTVICTLSKPTPQVFSLLDSIVLIANGRTIFSSEKENILPYFVEQLGYVLPHTNQVFIKQNAKIIYIDQILFTNIYMNSGVIN
jgi:ABC-type multidrug transport system ATPase subunit